MSIATIDGREQIVETLEQWLEEAREGRYETIAIAATMKDGAISTGFSRARSSQVPLLVGAVAHLQFRIHQEWMEPATVDPDQP